MAVHRAWFLKHAFNDFYVEPPCRLWLFGAHLAHWVGHLQARAQEAPQNIFRVGLDPTFRGCLPHAGPPMLYAGSYDLVLVKGINSRINVLKGNRLSKGNMQTFKCLDVSKPV